MGQPELLNKDHFETDTKRGKHATELKKIIKTWSSTMKVSEVLKILETHLVPSSPIFDIEQISESNRIRSRNMLVEVEHPVAGKTKIPALPVKFSETPAMINGPSPLLSEHTKEILVTMLGLKEKDIDRLKDAKVI
jgi:CoA:oxalate CoA-transferase